MVVDSGSGHLAIEAKEKGRDDLPFFFGVSPNGAFAGKIATAGFRRTMRSTRKIAVCAEEQCRS
jgi:hypothetical protein